MLELLKRKDYQSRSVKGAIWRWAPPSENNSGAYSAFISKNLGVSPYTPMSSLSNAQLIKMAKFISKYEGTKAGKTGKWENGKMGDGVAGSYNLPGGMLKGVDGAGGMGGNSSIASGAGGMGGNLSGGYRQVLSYSPIGTGFGSNNVNGSGFGGIVKNIKNNNSKSINIDLTNVCKGVYFISVKSENKKQTQKIILK